MIKKNKIQILIPLIIILGLGFSSFSSLLMIPDSQSTQSKENAYNDTILNTSASAQYISSVTISYGSDGPGSLSNTHYDNSNYKQYNSAWYGRPLYQHTLSLTLNFNPGLSGDYYLSVHITSTTSQKVYLYVSGHLWHSSNNLDLDNQRINDVTSIKLSGGNLDSAFSFRIYYLKLVPIIPTPPTKVTGLTAVGGLERVDLSWNANPESDINYYKIYRGGTYIGQTSSTHYADEDLVPGTYSYQVSAVNTHSLEGPLSDSKSATSEPTATPRYLDSVIINYGSEGSGTLGNTHTDDSNYKQYNSAWFGNPFNEHLLNLDLNIDSNFKVGNYYLSVHIESTTDQKAYLYINGEIYASSTNIDFDNQKILNVNSIELAGSNSTSSFNFRIFHLKLIPVQYAPLYLDSVTIYGGSEGSGTLGNTVTDNTNYKQYNSAWFGNPFNEHRIDLDLNFYPSLNGEDYYLSVHIESTTDQKAYLYINGEIYASSTNIDFDNQKINDVTSIRLSGGNLDSAFSFRIYYLKLIRVQPIQTWYDSNEEYSIGVHPSIEWNHFEGNLGVVQASHYGVDMRGKAIRLTRNGLEAAAMSKGDISYEIRNDKALLLSFKAQINGEGGVASIALWSGYSDVILDIMFNSDGEDIEFYFADDSNYFYEASNGQIYDIDAFIAREAGTNLVYYYVYINQELITVKSVTTNMVVIEKEIQAWADSFIIDEYFLGYTDFEILPEETRDIGIPMYYLYDPIMLPDEQNTYAEKALLYYQYQYAEQTTTTWGVFFGPTIKYFDIIFDIDLIELIEFAGQDFGRGTNGEDLIIYDHIEANITDIIFTLPGQDPDVGVDIVMGWHKFEFINESIAGDTIERFENLTKEIPQEYYDCKNNLVKTETRTFDAPGGGCTQYYNVASEVLETESTFSVAVGFGYDYGGYGGNAGVTYSFEYSSAMTAKLTLEILWKSGTPYGGQVGLTFDIFEPPQGTYSTTLNFAPIVMVQTEPC